MLALPANRFCTKLTSWWSAICALATCKAGGSVGYRAFYIENEFTPFATQPSWLFLLMKKIDLLFEEALRS